MAQITLDLDDETEAKLKAAAEAAGLSQSRWIGELIREKTEDGGPVRPDRHPHHERARARRETRP